MQTSHIRNRVFKRLNCLLYFRHADRIVRISYKSAKRISKMFAYQFLEHGQDSLLESHGSSRKLGKSSVFTPNFTGGWGGRLTLKNIHMALFNKPPPSIWWHRLLGKRERQEKLHQNYIFRNIFVFKIILRHLETPFSSINCKFFTFKNKYFWHRLCISNIKVSYNAFYDGFVIRDTNFDILSLLLVLCDFVFKNIPFHYFSLKHVKHL